MTNKNDIAEKEKKLIIARLESLLARAESMDSDIRERLFNVVIKDYIETTLKENGIALQAA